jgi:AraC-like DNA-binding protein
MQHEPILGYISRGDEEEHRLRQPYYSLSQRDSWCPPETRSRGLMVFDHKGRLVKADASAERILAAAGVELTRDPRLRIHALDTSDAKPPGDSELPDWLDPEWIEPVIEGNERLGTVVQIPDVARRSARRAQGGLPAHKLRRVVEFIEAHIDVPITLARLAAVVYLSPFHFHRQFKRSMGLTPGQYISQLRIKRARTLLSESDLPLAEVAAQVGFADQSHFTAAFRRTTSMTPATYRNVTATA